MKRIALVALITAVFIAALTVLGRRDPSRPTVQPRAGGDSVWYHASDVAQLARTGRPQLVEFFHPD
jgi:hypothetical protein